MRHRRVRSLRFPRTFDEIESEATDQGSDRRDRRDQSDPDLGGVPPTDPARGPIRDVLASRDFRRYWIAQFLAALGNGALRFVFVWLALDLSDNSSAPGLLGLAFGIPAFVLMIPAGAWSDRFDRKRLIVSTELAAATVLGLAAATAWLDLMTLPVAGLYATMLGALLTITTPAFQALVPVLVAPERLMTGAALQGMGLNAALLFGAMVGGGAIALAGPGGAFAALGLFQVLAAVAMSAVRLPAHIPPVGGAMIRDIVHGVRFGLRTQPIRSLIAIGLIAGYAWGAVTILLPEIAREELGIGAFQASLLFSALGISLFFTSMVIASRVHIARPGLLIAFAISTLLGGGVILMGLSRSYWLTFAVMLAWGVGGGTSITLQRGLLQRHTPGELMGRVMGLNSLAMLGSFPLAAATASVLAASIGPADALLVVGIVATLASVAVGCSRAIRTA